MIKDNDFIHLPELYLTLETLKKHIKQHYNLNITNMTNENKHSGYNDEQMAMTQLDIIHRYSVKLDTMITQEAYLEEWVKMKLSRVELMIASVKHALEGVEKFEDGGELARKQLLHISKYSAKLIEMLKGGSVLMSWMESNIAICADYMDGIYHHLDYTMGNRAKQMEYRDGGGVGMAERGKRIYTDWKGKKSNENWGKYNLYDKYNNILDLCADLVDFLRKTKEQLGEDYFISAKRDLLSALNSESVGYFDNGVLKFNAGGGIPNNYENNNPSDVWNMWTPKQRLHFLHDHVSSWINYDKRIAISNMDWKEFHNVDDDTFNSIARQLESHVLSGQYRNGGGVDSYGDMNPEQVWSNWSSSQRYHFIYDHMKQSTPRTQEDLSKKAYSFLPANVKQELHEHIHMGKYNAGGGVEEMREIEYADGGTIGTGKNAKALMKIDNDIWDKLNIDSGSQLYSDEKLQKKYAEELTKGLKNMGYKTYTLKAADILTDWNYHALRSAMTFMGYFGEKEKNNQLEYKRETKKIGLSYYGLTPEIFTK